MIAPAPLSRAPTRPGEIQDRLLTALGIRPMTIHELARELGINVDRLQCRLWRMNRRLGLIEPAGRRRSPGGRLAVIYRRRHEALEASWWRQPAYRNRAICPRCGLPDLLCSDPLHWLGIDWETVHALESMPQHCRFDDQVPAPRRRQVA